MNPYLGDPLDELPAEVYEPPQYEAGDKVILSRKLRGEFFQLVGTKPPFTVKKVFRLRSDNTWRAIVVDAEGHYPGGKICGLYAARYMLAEPRLPEPIPTHDLII